MLWVRALLVWLVLMAAESLHGTARRLLLESAVGELRARQLAFFTGSLIILCVACLLAGWLDARTRRRLLLVGCLWAALTLAFEVLLGRWVLHYPWERIASDYDARRGGLMALGLVLLSVAPFIAARVRRLRPFEVAARRGRTGDTD